jgi:hypothetical protein
MVISDSKKRLMYGSTQESPLKKVSQEKYQTVLLNRNAMVRDFYSTRRWTLF